MSALRLPPAVLFLVLSLMGMLHCDSLLFPKSEPIDINPLLDSPAAVIVQLETAYSHRSTQMMQKVFCTPADSFRFYIPVDPADRWEHIPPTRTEDVEVPTALVTKGKYIYLTASDEIDVLRHLFEQASEVTIQALQIIQTDYLTDTIVDTLIRLDSLTGGMSQTRVYSLDTTGAVVHTEKTRIAITSERLRAVFGTDSYEFTVGEQVFIMERTPQGIWGIRYWFELAI